METIVSVPSFLSRNGICIDVRSPMEFAKAHMPNAVNIPILNDSELATIGTLYKQSGKAAAIEAGLKIFGPNMHALAMEAKRVIGNRIAKVYCFRGGLRSKLMIQLFELIGISCITLKGGYKAFRFWIQTVYCKPYQLFCLSGLTGCGKTKILQELHRKQEQIIDLESLAHHKGSSFGHLGELPQPSTEAFENNLALQLHALNRDRPIWVEDESSLIGTCHIPVEFHRQMNTTRRYFIEKPLSERLAHLCETYSCFSREELIQSTQRICKRLGGLRTRQAIEAITQGDFKKGFALILIYYDKVYLEGLKKKTFEITILKAEQLDHKQWANFLMQQPQLLTKAI